MSSAKSASQRSADILRFRAEQLREQLVTIRRSIHEHPEYGFQEYETARLIAATLSTLGARVQEGVA